MKIVITGGGSGGHVYPLLAVADKIREISEDKNILQPEIFYLAEVPYDEDALFKNDVEFRKVYAGKLRKGFHFSTIFSLFKMAWGVADTLLKMFQIYPDVVFTNGGYVAFPVLVAARILRIPVVIHASDTVPSRVLLYAGKFAKKISIAFPEAAKFFPTDKVALLGNPIRDEVKYKQREGAHSYFNLDPALPTVLVIGGSQGSVIMNNTILDALPDLVKKYQIIHQTGKPNYNEVFGTAGVQLLDNPLKKRYKVYPYFNNLGMKMASGAADLIMTRAGAGSINEVANWGTPSILIPISGEVSRDQESNSFAYARSGAGVVIRQKNLSPKILEHEIGHIFTEEGLYQKMAKAAKNYFKPDADIKIANEVLTIALSHTK